MSLCQYKDLFGVPKKGSHSYRIPIINLAAIDVLMTIVAGYLISKYTSYSFIMVMIILFILSIIAHRLFCVRTTVDKFLFPENGSLFCMGT
jgi:hypothetical protein